MFHGNLHDSQRLTVLQLICGFNVQQDSQYHAELLVSYNVLRTVYGVKDSLLSSVSYDLLVPPTYPSMSCCVLRGGCCLVDLQTDQLESFFHFQKCLAASPSQSWESVIQPSNCPTPPLNILVSYVPSCDCKIPLISYPKGYWESCNLHTCKLVACPAGS